MATQGELLLILRGIHCIQGKLGTSKTFRLPFSSLGKAYGSQLRKTMFCCTSHPEGQIPNPLFLPHASNKVMQKGIQANIKALEDVQLFYCVFGEQ